MHTGDPQFRQAPASRQIAEIGRGYFPCERGTSRSHSIDLPTVGRPCQGEDVDCCYDGEQAAISRRIDKSRSMSRSLDQKTRAIWCILENPHQTIDLDHERVQ